MLNANMANVKQLFRGRKVTGTFEKRARARQQCQQCNKTVLNQLPLIPSSQPVKSLTDSFIVSFSELLNL